MYDHQEKGEKKSDAKQPKNKVGIQKENKNSEFQKELQLKESIQFKENGLKVTNSHSPIVQRVINDGDYNAARTKLISVGSDTANASHPKHTQGSGSPDGHGQGLLREARDEFRNTDAGGEGLKSGMTQAHYTAIHWAAAKMGIDNW